jgi:hypothetical protein
MCPPSPKIPKPEVPAPPAPPPIENLTTVKTNEKTSSQRKGRGSLRIKRPSTPGTNIPQ